MFFGVRMLKFIVALFSILVAPIMFGLIYSCIKEIFCEIKEGDIELTMINCTLLVGTLVLICIIVAFNMSMFGLFK